MFHFTKKFLFLLLSITLTSTSSLAADPAKNTRKPVKIQAPAVKAEEAGMEAEGTDEAAPARNTRSKPNFDYDSSGRTSRGQVGIELLGSALLYSLNGSYLVTDNIAINGGLSYFTVSSTSSGLNYSASVGVTQIPLSVSYLFGGPEHHFEILGGGDFVLASASVSGDGVADKATGSGFLAEIGAGYRYWPVNGGFHFRATLYGIAIPNSFAIWPGLSFGYAF